MKVLVTGRAGQVAQSLAERAKGDPEFQLVFAARPELDLENEASIRRAIRDARPDAVISAAAYTAVDQAEAEEDRAHRVNGVAPGILAEEARSIGAPIIHLSTDYVYDGQGSQAYREDAPVAPANAYGRTKLAGEEAVRAASPDHLILRTAWVYSPFGKNFVRTMLNLAGSRDRLNVVEDQVGNPTSALDIADALLHVLRTRKLSAHMPWGQTLHLAGQGHTSWADFARFIFATSSEFGGPTAEVVGIPTSAYPTPATRPANSRLDTSLFRERFGGSLPSWQESTRMVVERLLREPAEGQPAPIMSSR